MSLVKKKEKQKRAKKGKIARVWSNGQYGFYIVAGYSWHSEGWKARNEALMQAVCELVANCYITTAMAHCVQCHHRAASIWRRRHNEAAAVVMVPEIV